MQTSKARDPFTDPRPGDTFLGDGGVRLVCRKPVKALLEGLIWYRTAEHQECNAYPDSWERWAKNAEVLYAAD